MPGASSRRPRVTAPPAAPRAVAMPEPLHVHADALLSKARRYGWGLLAPASTLVAIFATNVIASRRLGTAEFGQFAVASALVTVLSVVAAFGVPMTLVTVLGREADDARVSALGAEGHTVEGESVRAWRGAALAIVWAAALAILAFVVGAELLLGDRVGRWFPRGTAFAIGIACLGTALLETSLAESQRLLEFRAYFARMVGGALTRLAGVAIGVYLVAPTARAAVWGYALATFASGALFAAPSTRLAFEAARRDRAHLVRLASRLFERSAPVLGSTLLVVATSWIDTIVIAGRMAASEVGVYAAAARLTVAPATLIGGISSLALPLAVSAWRHGRVDEFNAKVLRAGGLLSIVVVGAMVLGAHLIVRIVYGEAFAAATPVFMAMALGYLASFPGNPMSQVLFAAGRTRIFLVVQTVQLAATLVGLGLLLGRGGPLAVAVLRAVVNVAGTVVIMVVAMRLGRRQPVLAAQE